MSDLERAEQALRDAGFTQVSSTRWTRGAKMDWVSDDTTNLLPYTDDGGGLRYLATLSWYLDAQQVVTLLTAPALVQTLVDALKPFAFPELNVNAGGIPLKDEDQYHPRVSVGNVRKAREAITAVETANLPRMYTLEEILHQMGDVGSAVNDPNNGWTNKAKDAADRAFSMLMQRLEKPWKGGATT